MATTKWVIDPTHSEIGFKVKHLMFTNVSGTFGKYEAIVESNNDDFTEAKIELKIDVASISTKDASRDSHLTSADFFNVEQFQNIIFKSASMKKTGENLFELHGDLTMRDITKRVKLDVEYSGLMKDPWGNIKTAFVVSGKIHRKDWGLNWNATLETGGVLLSDEVKIHCEVQLTKKVEEPAMA